MKELNPIINLSCAKVYLGYGGTLKIDLGEMVEYTHPNLKGLFHGTWRVSSEYGLWRIYKSTEIIAGSYDEESVIETALKIFVDKKLKQVDVSESSSDTRLHFDDSLQVEFLETSSTDENWSVLGPDIYIGFGPGMKRRIQKPDQPGKGLNHEEEKRSIHANLCAERWNLALRENLEGKFCSDCVYYLPLRGEWYFWDFGVCSCVKSKYDGKIVKVNIGCDQHTLHLRDDTT